MSLAGYFVYIQQHSPKNKQRKTPPKKMSIRDDEMSNLLDISQDMETVVQPPRPGRATFSLSKSSDPYLIPKDEVFTSQAVRNRVPDGIGQRSDDNIVDLTNTQDGLRNLTESALEEEPEPAPTRLSRLKRKAKSKDVVSHEQHQPGHMAPRDSNVEVQPAYKKPRRAILEPEHEPGLRDVQELNFQDNEFLASMARVTEHIETLIRTRAVAFERKAEAEQHIEQAKRIIRKEMAVISDTSQQLQCLKTRANPVCDFVDRNKKDQPYPVCIQVGGGSASSHQPGGYRNASDSSDEFEPSEESPSGPGPQNAFTEQCETQNGSSLSEASDVGPNATPKENSAKILLNKLRQNAAVTAWDERGRFVYKGTAVDGSNMVDLIKAFTQVHTLHSKRFPKGWDLFMNGLAELNVPTSVAGNQTITLVRSRLAHVIRRLKVDCTESKVQLACAKMISRLTMLLNLFSEREYVKETSSLWKSYCRPMKNVANLATGNPRKRVNPEIASQGISEYGYGKRLFAISVTAVITMIMAVICLFESSSAGSPVLGKPLRLKESVDKVGGKKQHDEDSSGDKAIFSRERYK
ncbi:uncharacterized protein LOC128331346 [Hemicordylus capensis]|uniref:uncharacterized protein LOC128331346 n=1 Tax=Hemicordylus capensis TaxID=884348 RepID=UPI002303070E|nr:uncharacterized protein LOC128331346 [Hemicordylus capensis]